MHIKLLLLGQLLALSCSQIWADDALAHSDEQSLDDVHVLETTTTIDELVPDNEATARPDDSLLQLEEGLAVDSTGTVIPETTVQPEKTTPPTTTTTTTTSTAATSVATTESHKTKPPHPQVHPDLYPFPQPYPHPHLHSHSHPYAHPYPYPYGTSPQSRETGFPVYSHPNVHILRSPYGTYGVPVYQRGYPGLGPGLGHVHPSLSADGSEEKSKSESDETDDSAKNKSDESTVEGPKPPGVQPSSGYPPVYVIQRRPLLTRYPYATHAHGYGSPYGYRR